MIKNSKREDKNLVNICCIVTSAGFKRSLAGGRDLVQVTHSLYGSAIFCLLFLFLFLAELKTRDKDYTGVTAVTRSLKENSGNR